MKCNSLPIIFAFTYSWIVLSAEALPSLFDKPRYDLEGLNKWLEQSLPNDADQPEDLLRNVTQIEDVSVARSVGVILELSKVDECHPGVFEALRKLNDFGQIKVHGQRRIEKVLQPHLERIIGLCEPYLDQTIGRLFENSLWPNINVDFFEIITAEHAQLVSRGSQVQANSVLNMEMDPHYYYYTGNKFSQIYDPSIVEWADYLIKLSHKDPEARFEELFMDTQTGETHMIKNRSKFDFALKKYLKEPCELLEQVTGQFYEGAWALEEIQYSMEDKYELFLKRRSNLFNRLLYNLKICRVLLNMSPIRIEKIFNDVAEFPTV